MHEGWWWLMQPHDCGYGEDSGSLCQCSWLPPVSAEGWLVIWHHSACSGPSSSHWLTHPDLGGLGHQNLALTCVSLGSPGHLDPSVWPWGSFWQIPLDCWVFLKPVSITGTEDDPGNLSHGPASAWLCWALGWGGGSQFSVDSLRISLLPVFIGSQNRTSRLLDLTNTPSPGSAGR